MKGNFTHALPARRTWDFTLLRPYIMYVLRTHYTSERNWFRLEQNWWMADGSLSRALLSVRALSRPFATRGNNTQKILKTEGPRGAIFTCVWNIMHNGVRRFIFVLIARIDWIWRDLFCQCTYPPVSCVDIALSDVGRCHQQRLTLLFATRDQRSIAPMCCFATNLLHFPFKPTNAIRLALTWRAATKSHIACWALKILAVKFLITWVGACSVHLKKQSPFISKNLALR